MAVFSKHSNNFNAQTTIISNGAYIKGELNLNSMLHVDGIVEGILHSDGTIVIGKGGNIIGSVYAQKIVINGCFEGNIDAEFVEILSGAIVKGEISSLNLSIENGAKFSGQSILKDNLKATLNLEVIEDNSASKDL
ncbi:putative bactofilin domain protein [Campylobacter hyointestinalis subsp. hyointestinalis LMG 9260]|uniref:bactofilin family protein n=1 Tax=Campylobacter hyointestinalis TaxID=198 RepID=UPI0007C9791D|nr:polymer-forming cytoskeletal protein [Campylobacter hyointestinalis]ANE32708.1 putative bactofilin domain protein [Campylobacter hyointestinalis subsp. hyointestinalis LMG 9260]SUW88867.1 Polymer-forming cytoskeletal [Campylobacter hyointestinalis]